MEILIIVCASISIATFVLMVLYVFAMCRMGSMCTRVEEKRKPLTSAPPLSNEYHFLNELEKLSHEFHDFDCNDACNKCILYKTEVDNVSVCGFLFGLTEEEETGEEAEEDNFDYEKEQQRMNIEYERGKI
jgi:hypothetical protein